MLYHVKYSLQDVTAYGGGAPPAEGAYQCEVTGVELESSKNVPGLTNAVLHCRIVDEDGLGYEFRKWLPLPDGADLERDRKYLRGLRTVWDSVGFDRVPGPEGFDIEIFQGCPARVWFRPGQYFSRDDPRNTQHDIVFITPEHFTDARAGKWRPSLPAQQQIQGPTVPAQLTGAVKPGAVALGAPISVPAPAYAIPQGAVPHGGVPQGVVPLPVMQQAAVQQAAVPQVVQLQPQPQVAALQNVPRVTGLTQFVK